MKFGTFVVALAVAVVTPSVASFAGPDCRASRELLDLGHPLTVAHEAVAKDHELRIVAMGSSSTQGYGTTSPQFAYPAQLKLHLEKAMPGVAVHVINKGIGGQDAEEMTERMKSDVQPAHAQLVIWQVGTNSAIRHTPLDLFSRKLRAGIDIGRSLGAEFILMNLQYVPAVVALPDEQDYAHVMAQVAKEKGTGLFNRLAIMKAWYNDGMPYSQFVYNDGLHLNDFGQKCVGKLLSQAILRAVKPSQLTGDPKAGN